MVASKTAKKRWFWRRIDVFANLLKAQQCCCVMREDFLPFNKCGEDLIRCQGPFFENGVYFYIAGEQC